MPEQTNRMAQLLFSIDRFRQSFLTDRELPDHEIEFHITQRDQIDRVFAKLRKNRVFRDSDYLRFSNIMRTHFLVPTCEYRKHCERLGLIPDRPEATIIVDVATNNARMEFLVRCTSGECVSREEALGLGPLPPTTTEIYAAAAKERAKRKNKEDVMWEGVDGPGIKVCETR